MAVVGIVALIPITPGAVGVTEVAYIGILTSIAGSGMSEQLTAAVMLFRIAQWLAPIPIGWVLLIVMRRGHWGELLGGREDGSHAVLELMEPERQSDDGGDLVGTPLGDLQRRAAHRLEVGLSLGPRDGTSSGV